MGGDNIFYLDNGKFVKRDEKKGGGGVYTMTPKDFIEQAKDYADIADAGYAVLYL